MASEAVTSVASCKRRLCCYIFVVPWHNLTKVGDESSANSEVRSSDKGRKVEERSRERLGKGETSKEGVEGDPPRVDDLRLEHRKNNLTSTEDDGPNTVHALEERDVSTILESVLGAVDEADSK